MCRLSSDISANKLEDTLQQFETSDELREKGNLAVRAENFTEAVLHYSFAIKLSPNDPILYSNRSFAFFKLKQLYYANEDAETAIRLNPDWAKGHFRRAEVQAAAKQFDSSLLSYGRALQLQPNNISILNAAKQIVSMSNRDALYSNRMPWVGAGIGIILGVIIVILDHLITKSPSIKHPSLMVLMVMFISGICYGIVKVYLYYSHLQRSALLDPPIDLLNSLKKNNFDANDVEEDFTPNRSRYSKAQARQRFKKGKFY